MKAYRIAIVEPAEVVGEGIAAMLSRSADTEVVLLAKSLAEVAPRVRIGDIDALFVSVGLTSLTYAVGLMVCQWEYHSSL